MMAFILQSLLWLLIAFILGLWLGRILRGIFCKATAGSGSYGAAVTGSASNYASDHQAFAARSGSMWSGSVSRVKPAKIPFADDVVSAGVPSNHSSFSRSGSGSTAALASGAAGSVAAGAAIAASASSNDSDHQAFAARSGSMWGGSVSRSTPAEIPFADDPPPAVAAGSEGGSGSNDSDHQAFAARSGSMWGGSVGRVKPAKRAFADDPVSAGGGSTAEPVIDADIGGFKSDNLQIIEGIGPKIKSLLHKNGIVNWSQLGNKSEADLRAILDRYGDKYQMIAPAIWIPQAKLAAAGEVDALITLQNKDGVSKLEKMMGADRSNGSGKFKRTT